MIAIFIGVIRNNVFGLVMYLASCSQQTDVADANHKDYFENTSMPNQSCRSRMAALIGARCN
jgi:hypothetical protein